MNQHYGVFVDDDLSFNVCPRAAAPIVEVQNPLVEPTIGDPLFPQLGAPRYRAVHYTLDHTVDVARNQIAGTATMNARAQTTLASFALDFKGLTVHRVTVDGTPAQFTREPSDKLVIRPSRQVGSNQNFTVAVTYHGRPQTLDGARIRMPPFPVRLGLLEERT